MKVVKRVLPICMGMFLFLACQKEFSEDTGILPGVSATGTLKDTLNDCKPIVISGTYYADSSLKDSNYVTVQVNVASAGAYKIYSDTVSGFSFIDSGYFFTTGLKDVKLKGTGKPLAAGTEDFLVTFGNSICLFSITVNAGTPGGGTPQPRISDYFPTTTNSFWEYALDVFTQTLRYTVQPANVSINNLSYRHFEISANGSEDSLFFRKESGNYFEYGDIDPIGSLDSVGEYIDYIFLKDNVPVNSTWESGVINAKANGSNSTGKAKAQFNIVAKDVQKTINGVPVDSVIQVQRSILFQSSGSTTFQNLGSYEFFYAKNRGLLLVTGNLPLSGAPIPLPFRLEAKNYRVF